ncbi:MAG: DUF4404 family protein, partial [Pseudomonadota bacterium]
MSNEKIRELFIRLRDELKQQDETLDSQTRDVLAELDGELHALMSNSDEDIDLSVEEARRLEARFAAQHPTAARVIREVIDTLTKL